MSNGPGALALRALELHGDSIWSRTKIEQAISWMNKLGLNTLVLHESDIVHRLVYPRAYFDAYALWTDMPSRRGENAIFNDRAYFDWLLQKTARAGIAVMLNVKEIAFPLEVLSLQPGLMRDGVVCPSEPFWEDFVEQKYHDLVHEFSDLTGVIVSIGSQESLASKVQNRCKCRRCVEESLEDWYYRLISGIHRPIARAGKLLAVREFAYKPEDHTPLMAAMTRLPRDIVLSIKAMPHDFYLTFPDNPAIGALDRRQWVEYDVMGQFTGWGLIPCPTDRDFAGRMRRWCDAGVEGVILRVEWERLNDLTALDTIALVNLIHAARLASGDEATLAAAVKIWLSGESDDGVADDIARLLRLSEEIVIGAAYSDGFVTADNSMFPRSVERFWWGAETRDALLPWLSGGPRATLSDPARMEGLLAEKRMAVACARHLDGETAKLCEKFPEASECVLSVFGWVSTWAEGHEIAATVCLRERLRPLNDDLKSISRLDAFSVALCRRLDEEFPPHHLRMLVDPGRLADVRRTALVSATGECIS